MKALSFAGYRPLFSFWENPPVRWFQGFLAGRACVEVVRGATIRATGPVAGRDALRGAVRSWAESRDLIPGLEICAASGRVGGRGPDAEISMRAGAYLMCMPFDASGDAPGWALRLGEVMDANHDLLARCLRDGPAGGLDGPPFSTQKLPPPPRRGKSR